MVNNNFHNSHHNSDNIPNKDFNNVSSDHNDINNSKDNNNTVSSIKNDKTTSSDPTLENYLFRAVSLTKNANINKYKYSGYCIGFDRRGSFSIDNAVGRSVIIFGVDMSSSTKIDNRKKDILILGKRSTQELEHTLSAEKMYSIKFTEKDKKFCLSLHYNKANSYLFVNGKEIHKFKAKDSEIVATPLCLGNISKDWSVDNMKKTRLNGYVYDFIKLLLQLMIYETFTII